MITNTNHAVAGPLDPKTRTALAHLDAHPDFRVLRRLPSPQTLLSTLPPVLPLRVAALLDVETTGLFAGLDDVIELAAQRVRFDALGRFVQIGKVRSWLQQPSEPLTPEITQITGLTDAVLAGQQIDIKAATSMIGGADIVVAHNAAFDRPFVDLLLPGVRDAAWACSMCEVDWRGLGFEGRALNHLVYQVGEHGHFFGGHRAATDVMALLTLLGHRVGEDDGPILGCLIAAAEQASVKLMAVGAPFDRKDLLKRRGYRWDPNRQHWWIAVKAEDEKRERTFLAECVYRPGQQPQTEILTWHDRYCA